MTVSEVESYYGKVDADWVREKIADGTFKPPAVAVRLENPKRKRNFLKVGDLIPYEDGIVTLPDHLRYSDNVRIEIEDMGNADIQI